MKSDEHKRKQWMIMIPLSAIVLIGGVAFWAVSDERPLKKSHPRKTEIPSAKIATGKVWQDKVEDKTDILEKEIRQLKEVIRDLGEKTNSSKASIENRSLSNGEKKILDQLVERLDNLEQSMGEVEEGEEDLAQELSSPKIPRNIQSINFSFSSDQKKVQNYLPAGSSMRCVLLTALHAPTGLGSPKNPFPVKFRVIDNAYFPKGVHAKVKGAMVIGDAYGDLSSKRMRVRLQNLVLMKSDGSFEECKISGWVTGEDGAEGIGANAIIDYGDEIIAYAGVASLFSGFGKYLEATVQNQQLGKIRADDKYSSFSIVKGAGAEGIAGGFDKIADHWMQRLEAIMPAVYVVAGRECDLHLSKTVELNSKIDIKEELRIEREMARKAHE